MTNYMDGILRTQVLRPTLIRDVTMYYTMIEHTNRLVQTTNKCIKSLDT